MRECPGRILFAGLLTSVAAVMLVLTIDLSPTAKAVPLAAGIPTVCLLLTALWMDIGSRALHLAPTASARREIREISWLAALPILMYLVGFFLAIPLFLLLYVKSHSRQEWAVTLGVSMTVGLGLYLVFGLFLQVDLGGGQLWVWLVRGF